MDIPTNNDDNEVMEASSSLREKAHEKDFERMKEEHVSTNNNEDFKGTASMAGIRKMILRDMTFTERANNDDDDDGFFFFNSPLEWTTNVPMRVPMIYCDFTASHRPLQSIENYIRSRCLPYYGNTHTNTSLTGSQSSAFVSEARQIIAEACNAKITGKASEDVVLFAGNGTTSAVRLLIDCLGLKHFKGVTSDEASIIKNERKAKALIVLGPFEHHSNLLPWRELGGDQFVVETVKQSKDGSTVDLVHLEQMLIDHRKNYPACPFIIGSFSAASNVTGVLVDDITITKILHKHGALSFWDYATGASYLNINVNPNPSLLSSNRDKNDDVSSTLDSTKAVDIAKDAVFYSGHKLLGGGGGTPGVLIVKKRLVSTLNSPGQACGGGTVFYVTKDRHRFLSDRIERYEGGTPNIVGIWRLGLVWKLKLSLKRAAGKILLKDDATNHSPSTVTETTKSNMTNTISPSSISSLLSDYDLKRARIIQQRLSEIPNLVLLDGNFPRNVLKLPIFSFLIRCGKRFLHYNYVCALLNDMFGIQSRGGCQCAGPYHQYLLGMNSNGNENEVESCGSNDAVEKWLIHTKDELMRPGATRLSLPTMGTTVEVEDFVVDAIRWVSTHGWKLLHVYRCNHRSGEWRHKSRPGAPLGTRDRQWLSYYQMPSGDADRKAESNDEVLSLSDVINNANEMLRVVINDRSSISQTLKMSMEEESSSPLRWYVYPKDVVMYIKDGLDEVPVEDGPPNTGMDILGALKPLALFTSTPKKNVEIESEKVTMSVDSSTAESKNIIADNLSLLFFRDGEHSGEASLEEIIEGRDDGELSDLCKIFDPATDEWRVIDSFLEEDSSINNAENYALHHELNVEGPHEDAIPTDNVELDDEDFRFFKNDRKKPQRDASSWGKGQVQPLTLITNMDNCDGTDLNNINTSRRRISRHVKPPPKLMRLCTQAMIQWDMLEDGDRLLLGLSGGKDSMSLLHVLLEFQKKLPVRFEIEVCTIDPLTPSYDPSVLIPYVESLGLKYHYIRDNIVDRAASAGKDGKLVTSLCAFCARMKRGNLYTCARKNNCNKLVLAQHLDDLAESFMMSVMHNGFLRTMKANYTINSGDLSVIRPFAYVRESMLTEFAKSANFEIVNENCPACFEEPKERARMKKLLSKEEALYPSFYDNIKRAMLPLMHDDATALMRSYTEEALAKSRKGVKKKPFYSKNKSSGIHNGKQNTTATISDVQELDHSTTNDHGSNSLEDASDEMLLRELSRRRANKFRLAGSMARDLRDGQSDPMGQVCSLKGGNGTIPCTELME